MEEVAEFVGPIPEQTPVRRRIDPRTGKEMACHPRSFWEEHERRRAASGLSISQYCSKHGLALSTLRRWSARLQGREAQRPPSALREAKGSASASAFLSVPIVASPHDPGGDASGHDAPLRVEVLTRGGTRVRLFGEAADGVMQAVMAELAASR